jgi:thioesterase domain-containing protein
LIGQSSGGVIAFEAAHILSRMGEDVASVFLLDTAAPGLRPWNATDLDLIKVLADGNLDGDEEELSKLEGDEQLVYAVEQLKKRGIVPSDYNLDLARRRLAVLKNNLTATNTYVPGPYGGHVVLFAAETSTLGNVDAWKKYVSGSLEVEHVAGRHSQLLLDPFVRQIAQHTQRYIDNVRKGSFAPETN